MKLIKNILLGLGSLFVLLVVIAIYTHGQSSEFKDKNTQFAKDFTHDFSQQWDVSTVSNITTNNFLSKISTPTGQHALSMFRTFGKLTDANDVELIKYISNVNVGATATFKFKATFEKVKAVITIVLKEKNNEIKVHGFHITPISTISSPKEFQA